MNVICYLSKSEIDRSPTYLRPCNVVFIKYWLKFSWHVIWNVLVVSFPTDDGVCTIISPLLRPNAVRFSIRSILLRWCCELENNILKLKTTIETRRFLYADAFTLIEHLESTLSMPSVFESQNNYFCDPLHNGCNKIKV